MGPASDLRFLLGSMPTVMNSGRAVHSSFNTPIATYSPGHRSRFLDEMKKREGRIEIGLKLERCFQQTTKLGR
jgi:hypothetical protein